MGKLEKSSSRLYKSSKETHKEVYDVDHKFISQIRDKMERDSSINLSTLVTSSLIFKALDHVVQEEKKSNHHSLFCIHTGLWDGPSQLKRSCATIWQKGYAYFQLVAFSWQLGSHAVLMGVHTEEACQWRKISEKVPSSLKQLKELVFCPWCGLPSSKIRP